MIRWEGGIKMDSKWFQDPPIKPGCLPEPPEPVSTRDPQSAVDRCLECKKAGEKCSGECKPVHKFPKGMKGYWTECRVRDMINAGWKNNEAICEELHISKTTFTVAKRRLRERGEIS